MTSLYEFGPQRGFIVYVAEQKAAGRPELFRVEFSMPRIAQADGVSPAIDRSK